MKHKRWTAEEDAFLRENYRERGPTWCAEWLPERTYEAVKYHAGSLGVSAEEAGPRVRSGACASHTAVIEELVLAGVPVSVIAQKLGICYGTLSNYVYRYAFSAELKLRQNDLADEIIARHREAI